MRRTPVGTTEILVDRVVRCRRRLLLVAFIRHACISTTIAVALAAALVVGLRLDMVVAATWLAGAGAIGVAVGAVIATILTPSLTATAAALDTHLRLEDRVVTALQLMEDEDAVAQLVIRDASVRMAAVAPRDVFPFTLGIGWRMLLASGAFAFALLLVALWAGARAGRPSASHPGTVTNGLPRPVSGAASDQSREGAIRIVEDASAPITAGQARERLLELTADRGSVEKLESPPKGGPEGPPLRSEIRRSEIPPSTGVTGRRESNISGRPDTTGSASSPATDTSFRGTTSLAGSGDNTSAGLNSKTRPPSETTGGAPAGAPGSTGRDGRSGESSSFGSGAGGIGGSPLRNTQAEIGEPPTSELSYAARYRAAWVRAQMALAQSRVPKDLRNYVRDYFAAIRPLER